MFHCFRKGVRTRYNVHHHFFIVFKKMRTSDRFVVYEYIFLMRASKLLIVSETTQAEKAG